MPRRTLLSLWGGLFESQSTRRAYGSRWAPRCVDANEPDGQLAITAQLVSSYVAYATNPAAPRRAPS